MSTAAPTVSLLPDDWRVCLPVFEGPLDLLLHLIRVNQVEITDIPVAHICDQFHAYLALAEELDLDIAGEYIYMAAYLIFLKSKMLLPRPKAEDGQTEEEDPRQDLVLRLLEYRRLKEVAQTLAEVDSVRRGMWLRESDELRHIAKEDPPALDLGEISLFDLLRTFKTVLDRYHHANPPPMLVSGETFSVRDQLDRLLEALDRGRPYDFLDDLRCLSGRREAIAAILALLELTRMRLVRLHQTESGEILLYRTTLEARREDLEAVQG